MTQTEALKLALEALLEATQRFDVDTKIHRKAITAIKEALAQPEQEPAWYHAECDDPDHSGFFKEAIDAVTQVNEHGGYVTELYTFPPQPKEPEQEPVAWRFQSAVGGWAYGKEPPIGSKYAVEPLYTAPPQRTWVGLTDIDYAGLPLEQVGLVRWAETKLKQKNGYAEEKNT